MNTPLSLHWKRIKDYMGELLHFAVSHSHRSMYHRPTLLTTYVHSSRDLIPSV